MTWTAKATLPDLRGDLGVAASSNGKLYAIGGENNSQAPQTTTYEYDPATDTWATRAAMPAARRKIGCAAIGDKLYVIAGDSASTGSFAGQIQLYEYDSTANTWASKSSIGAGNNVAWVGHAVIGTKLYGIGGNISASNTTTLLREWDQATNTWTGKAALPSGRARAAVGAIGTKLYVAGGVTSLDTALDTLLIWDQATNTWTTGAAMPGTVREAAGAVVNGKLYVIGGRSGSTYLTTVYRYDPGTNTWETLTALGLGRSRAGAAAIGSTLYLVGGMTGNTTYASTAVQGLVVNEAPNAPTLTSPVDGTAIDRAITQRLAWTFSDPDAGDTQSAYDLRYRLIGAPSWTDLNGVTPNAFRDITGGTFTAGDYEWQVRTYDAAGIVGPYSTSSYFTAANKPSTPTITAPISGGTVAAIETVTWSAPDQDAYQLRTVADLAGDPDTSTVYSDTGTVLVADARSKSTTFAVNNRFEHIQVRVRNDGLWSDWATIRVEVSYTPPPAPAVVLVAGATTIDVQITNPAPGGGEPALAYNEVHIDDGQGEERRATDLPTGTWTYRTPRSGYDYDGRIRVVAVATNGTTASTTA